MDVLVVGGTGFVGTHLSTALRERDQQVTAMARTPDETTVPAGVKTVTGDVTDYDRLVEVLPDYDAVVHLVSLSPLYEPRGGRDAHEHVTVGGTRTLVRAMADVGIDRLLFQSALGADPNGPTAYIRTKGRAEGIVRSSDLDWTILQPSVIFGDGDEFVGFTRLLTTPYLTALPGGGRTKFEPIWVGDFCQIAIEALTDPSHIHETYEIGGPEVFTLAEVATAIYEADGRSLRVLPIPMLFARIGLTVASPIPVIPFGPDQYRSLTFENVTDENAVASFGLDTGDLRSFSSYLAGNEV